MSCGMLESLLKVVNWYDEGQEHITVSNNNHTCSVKTTTKCGSTGTKGGALQSLFLSTLLPVISPVAYFNFGVISSSDAIAAVIVVILLQ